jgi:hypothetical protein
VVEPDEEAPEFPSIVVGVGAGLTVASFALPIALYFRAQGEFDEADELGPGHTGYAAARDEFESANVAYQVSWALPAALGAVTLGVAIWGAVHVSSGDGSAPKEGGTKPKKGGAEAVLVPAPGGGMFLVRGAL